MCASCRPLLPLWLAIIFTATANAQRAEPPIKLDPRPIINEPEGAIVGTNSTTRLPDGTVLLLLPDNKGPQLLVSRMPRPITLKDFGEPITLFGQGGVLSADNPGTVGIETAGSNIYIVHGSSKGLQWHSTALPIGPQSKWQRRTLEAGQTDLQDLVSDGKGRVYAIYRELLSAPLRARLSVATLGTGEVRSLELIESRQTLYSARGVLDESGDSTVQNPLLRVVWAESELAPRVRLADVYVDSTKESPAAREMHDGSYPTIAAAGGRTFIASEQPDGAIRVDWRGADGMEGTQTLRGRAGYRPELVADLHGVVWLFSAGLDQRGLYYRRFLGSGFSDEAECGGAPGTWKLSFGYSVQPLVRASDDGFALLAGEYLGGGDEPMKHRYRFHNLQVPRHTVSDPRHVMFLDMLEIAEVENLEQKVNAAVRSEANPLNLNGPKGSLDGAVAGYACVIHENGKFRLWYNADSDDPGRTWVICYAESTDGVTWTKPDLGLFEYKGSKKNNMVFPVEHKTSAPFIIRDDRESDPAKRYKVVMESGYQGTTSVYLGESPDGIHWKWPPHPLWIKGKVPGTPKEKQAIRGFHPWHEPLSSFFYDPLTHHPDYRWKIYGQDAWASYPNFDPRPIRNVSLVHGATPYEFKGYEGNPVIEPRTGYQEDQVHGALVQPYQGMYVSLYQHWWGDDWFNDLRLAASRDGIHFVRIQPQTAVLPLGAPGSWDAGMVTTPNFVFPHQGKLWLYYRGSNGTLATGRIIQEAQASPEVQEMGEAWTMLTGLAKLREDGFAYLTPGPMRRLPQPARTTIVPNYRLPLLGRVSTIPLGADGISSLKLHVNVEFFAPGIAWLKAQLRDADSGEVIPGYSFDACDPIREAGLDRTITWKGSADLGKVKAARVRVEFQLFGTLDQPKLYSFWFQ